MSALNLDTHCMDLLAPNGDPSNLPPWLWRVVRTSRFRQWFGDWEHDPENASKVLDENGEPLVQYHFARSGGFDCFKMQPFGAHFGDALQADAIQWLTYKDVNKPAAAIYPVFLSVRRPVPMRDVGNFQFGSDVGSELLNQEAITKEEMRQVFALAKCLYADPINIEREVAWGLLRLLMRKGYDGASYFNTHEGGGLSWIVFRPEGIKSVFNRGTFDAASRYVGH